MNKNTLIPLINIAVPYGANQAISLFGVVSKGATVVEDVRQVGGEVKSELAKTVCDVRDWCHDRPLFYAYFGFFAFLISGIFRIWLKLGDDEAMFSVFIPVAIVLFIVLVKRLPRSLRKMGIISDPPDRFGPWFK
ncbi:hypothetical protein L0Z16_18790 [Burkholderia multivorans]|uniref:hypothetical protein n=1 Tax=Burkholderia multivorans TaxID=87883 RepID=UPI002018AF6C|nr:hypothetical protein [Burkholderia multivorans]MCL4661271.1 hypothetical protein [Burkholderia multivorans]MCO1352701.1 hypothetical protein [Burkholderia multivorans]MCO1413452.1 hypothetical protein [Burkholderia multivorans]MCO1446357.1 hypothetical protein [Burkholderia multivorans]UQP46772.1 hypothetical protein L0Z16_18790 [Burkholderia multivorans]